MRFHYVNFEVDSGARDKKLSHKLREYQMNLIFIINTSASVMNRLPMRFIDCGVSKFYQCCLCSNK